jgi:hypothetical protein
MRQESPIDNAKTWLQSQGILFQGATPKRADDTVDDDNDNNSCRRGPVKDVTSPGDMLDTDDEDNGSAMSPNSANMHMEPMATPPSRWQQMFANDTTTTTTTTPPHRELPPPPPSPSSFHNSRPAIPVNLMKPLEWDQSTADVDEWIARVKDHSDKIAEEMFERAGLSPPRSISDTELRFLSREGGERGERGERGESAGTPLRGPPVQQHNIGSDGNDIDPIVQAETAQEAREILSSWMHMDDEARQIRSLKKKEYQMKAKVNADRREEDVTRTKHTLRPVPYEQTLRGQSSPLAGDDEDLSRTTQRQRQRRRQRVRNQRELDEQRADQEASEILSLAERMVLQPLHRDDAEESSNDKNYRDGRDGQDRRAGANRGTRYTTSDPRLMMEARQASIRQKRSARKLKQHEQDKLLRNMTAEEKRQHRAQSERVQRQQARQRRQRHGGGGQDNENRRRRNDRSYPKADNRNINNGNTNGTSNSTDAAIQNVSPRPCIEENSSEARRAIVRARKEVRQQREERKREAVLFEKERKREALRVKLTREKEQEEKLVRVQEQRRKEAKRREFACALIQGRRRERTLLTCFRSLRTVTVIRKKRRRQKNKELERMSTQFFFTRWKTTTRKQCQQRVERMAQACVYCTFMLLSTHFQPWRRLTQVSTF